MTESRSRTATFSELVGENLLEIGAGRPRSVSSNLPILRVADVLDGKIGPSPQNYAPGNHPPATASKVSKPGDVVLTIKGTVGRVAIMPADGPIFAYSPQLYYFRPAMNGPLRPRYLYYWFKSAEFWTQANSLKSQTDMADFLSLSDVQSLSIRIPPIKQQAGIVDLLGALDDKIAVNERIAATAMVLGRMKFLEAYFAAEQEITVGDVIELKYGRALPAARRVPGDILVYGSGGPSGFHNDPLVKGPGIIVGRKGTVGSVYWSEGDFFPIDTTFYVACKSDSISLEYAYFGLRELGLEQMNSDSAVPGLNRERAHALVLRIPAPDAMRRFTADARSSFELQHIRESESRTLAALRDTLLPQLMSGRLRVKDAEMIVEDAL
ncbi:restriction endonuclease subunit S [Microbispora bryophytorum]|uniref:restriction endonuclease subunit S n=1 Tax=Microbispora bryophytorum TaxID=1460882 RepID=UPI0034107B3B